MYLLLFLIPAAVAAWYVWPSPKLSKDAKITRLVVYKSKHTMEAYSSNILLKTYTVAVGRKPGKKEFEGDKKTPEGTYAINERNANSSYHKNLGVSYPNAADIAYAEKLGKPAGSLIKIHGLRNGRGYIGKFHRFKDWTFGCIAVTNEEIDELYAAVVPNAEIEIKP
jgi:murein L,D-transpeptidase YafK